MNKMSYKGYIGKVIYEDNEFYGEVINIHDIVTFKALTLDGLQKAFSDSVEDYFSFCASRGEQPNKPSLMSL